MPSAPVPGPCLPVRAGPADSTPLSGDPLAGRGTRRGLLRWLAQHHLAALLAFALLARLLTLGLYPLTDNTEARYGEIARKMLETGQWIVPQIDYGVPFWGKPPLSMWLGAISYQLFGVNAFAARLPSLLLAVAVCFLVFRLGLQRNGREYGLRASVVVATSLLMLVSAGGVMTDPAMLLGTTLCMVAYWLALHTASRCWGYLFFVGLAIGLLAKGPVASVLTVLPIGLWVLLKGRVADGRRRLPWLGGSALLAVLVVPWYWAAEMQSPGFLHYFIIGEHLQRFLVPGWQGDLYGVGHAYPRGTIWLYALAGTLPWSPWLLWQLFRHGARQTLAPLRDGDGWGLYLLCWMLAPAVFFTLSRNILPTYFLPGLIGFGLIAAQAWQQRPATAGSARTALLALVTPLLSGVLLVAWSQSGFQSQQDIVSAYRQSLPQDAALVYFRQRPYSAEFYSQGRAGQVDDAGTLRGYLQRQPQAYVATEAKALALLPPDLRAQLVEVTTSQHGKYLLLRQLPALRAANGAGPAPSPPGDTAVKTAAALGKLRVSRE